MRLFAETALLPQGWARNVVVGVDGGRIVSVDAAGQGRGQPDGAADASVGCLLPAPVNLHSHAFQRAMAGLTERRGATADSFWTWRDLMYRFLDRLTPEDVEAIAAQVMVEMAEAGYAGVAEFHYLHHRPNGAPYADLAEMAGRIAAAAEATGLGLTLLPVLYQQGGLDGRALGAGQLRFGNDPERFGKLWQAAGTAIAALPDAVLGVAPHSLRAVTGEGLRFAATLGGPLHIHLAEQMAEVEQVLAHTGARPVEWLLSQADVDARWCAIHATQMRPAETAALAQSGAVAGLCPITEANLGDGIFDGARYLVSGGAFGVGSDSNVRISLTEELRLLEYSQRLRDRGRAVLATAERSTGRVLYEGAVKGGAQAAGRAAGAISPGMWADLVALDTGHLHLEGLAGDDLLDAFIFAGDDRLVADLWSAGRHIVQGGRHVARAAVQARFRAVMGKLRTRL
ncbi:formimidoylglutamate deiminase [Gemmobacter straminiformis]|uniref:Formimidoylglutamate deiminase n=2 Tax=Paragemmobacter straminiformis TaxID=2045119 RepID=A0A842I537_9RHOB|nr:formimidoylglutamate deiminase [Gemmobacter straminiformis]MBC2835242.1 formimidoylglutamate deiminase [Gemmobacter straminiformis]